MRDLAVLGFMLALVPLALANTFNAYLLWGWAGLISLNSFMYGMMSSVQYVQIFAVIALGRLLFLQKGELAGFKSNRTSILFMLFLVHGLLCALFAYDGLPANWLIWTDMFKTLLFCLLMPMLATDRFRIHALVFVIAIAIGMHGSIDGLKFLASGGFHNAIGNVKFGDNNHFAMVMVMGVPLLYYLFQYSSQRITRVGFLVTMGLLCLTVVATKSRGGLLTMAIAGIWIVMYSRRKFTGLLMIMTLALLVLQLAPDSWFDRMETLKAADQDISFMGRVTAWKRASAIAVENPVLGGGFHAGQAWSIFEQFRYKSGVLGFVDTPDIGYPAASHSIYFEILGDLGFVGLLLFLACLVNAFFTSREIARMVGDKHPQLAWAADLGRMLMISLVAYAVGGAALSAAYFDLPYIVMMLMEVVKACVRREIADSLAAVDGSAVATSRARGAPSSR